MNFGHFVHKNKGYPDHEPRKLHPHYTLTNSSLTKHLQSIDVRLMKASYNNDKSYIRGREA
jgi:hypothetical protein